MIAVIKKTTEGFETTVLNDDMTQPTRDEQHAFMMKYASSVLKPVLRTATAGQERDAAVNITNITVRRCTEGED